MDLKLQLHLHTTESRGTRVVVESLTTPKQAVDVARENEIDAIAITDHNTTDAYSTIKNYSEKKGILLINGIEIDTRDGHIIGLGVDSDIDRKIDRSMSAEEAVDVIRDHGGIVYIPHLFDIRNKGLGTKVKDVDGIIEVFNSLDIFGFEDRYADFVASKLGRPKAVGADAHSPNMIPTCLTIVDSELDENSILKTLKKGKIRFENCRHMSLKEMKELSMGRVLSSYDDIKKKIKHGWEVDYKYMIPANFSFMKPLQRGALELGKRRKDSRIWDFVTYISYILTIIYAQFTKKEFDAFISTL